MLFAITLLLFYQLAGEVISRLFSLSIPGPVIGMVLLLLTLLVKDAFVNRIEATVNGMLKNLSLLFVPAGVGVTTHFHLLGDQWSAILVALVASTLISLVITALTMKLLMRVRMGKRT